MDTQMSRKANSGPCGIGTFSPLSVMLCGGQADVVERVLPSPMPVVLLELPLATALRPAVQGMGGGRTHSQQHCCHHPHSTPVHLRPLRCAHPGCSAPGPATTRCLLQAARGTPSREHLPKGDFPDYKLVRT